MSHISEKKLDHSLAYIAISSLTISPGVTKKVQGFTDGALKLGYVARPVIIEPSGLSGVMSYINEIIKSREDYVLVRYLPKIGFIYLFIGVYLRLKGQKLIIDVPTPMKNHIREIYSSKESKVRKLFFISWIYLMAFLPFISCFRIIQYAKEAPFFAFLNNNRTKIVGNGVDTSSMFCRKEFPIWPNSSLNLVAVGTVAFWHGWDKLIDVIDELRHENLIEFDIHLTIVGEGPDLEFLKAKVKKLDLNRQVKFTGFLIGKDLDEIYSQSHLGVGSLGWKRIGVDIASPLKGREYLAAGLPFLYSAQDVDFEKNNKCAIFINDDKIEERLKSFFKESISRKFPTPEECRKIAEDKLDFASKVEEILS